MSEPGLIRRQPSARRRPTSARERSRRSSIRSSAFTPSPLRPDISTNGFFSSSADRRYSSPNREARSRAARGDRATTS